MITGLAARTAIFLFVKSAGFENPEGLGALFMLGALYDFIAVVLLRLVWPKPSERS